MTMGEQERQSMVHVSFDLVDRFTPRIPEHRCLGEDGTIPRICVAPDVLSAVNTMPQGGYAVARMLELGLPPIVHAYYMSGADVMENDEVSAWVPDAQFTGEAWFLTEPAVVRRVDYRIESPVVRHISDHETEIVGARLRMVRYTDNWDNLLKWMGADPATDAVRKLKANLRALTTYRTFITNFSDEDLDAMRQKLISES